MPSQPDDRFRAQIDARTMADAAEIIANPKRFKGAQKAAGAMAREQQAQAAALKKVASKLLHAPKKAAKKAPRKR
jgi:hypothetical protein